jgi:hypothetical protein
MQKTIILYALMILSISSVMLDSLSASGQNYNIPNWIKNNAKWWSEGQIDDTAFVSGIQYLIQNGMMDVGNSNGQLDNEAIPENQFNVPVDKDAELPNGLEVEYNVLFVTSGDNCTWDEFGKMHFYNEATFYYLQVWGLEPIMIDPLCVPNTSIETLPDEYFGKDLTIIVTDEAIGYNQLLLEQHEWGHFQTPNLIVMGDLKNVAEYFGQSADTDIASEWTLSHELAHFVLYFVGEPEEIWVDWVHDTQEADYYCLDPNNVDDSICTEIYDTIIVNGMEVIVMKPYAYYYYE